MILLPRLTFSPLRAWAGFLSWFRLCSARRDGSTAELCSGQASSSTENICLTVGPQNMDPLMEVRPREQRFWCVESYSRNCCDSLNLKTLYQHLSLSSLKFKELKSVNKLAYQACFSVVNPGLVGSTDNIWITSLSGCFAHCVYVWGYFWRSELCMETRPLWRSSSGWGSNM